MPNSPGWVQGYVPSASEWNAEWASKLDYNVGGIPIIQGGTGAATAAGALVNLGALPLAGGTLTGPVTFPASASGGAGIVLPQGSAPTSPTNGSLWTTSAAVFARLGGVTQQLGQVQATITSTGVTVALGGQYLVATSLSSYVVNLPAVSSGLDGQSIQIGDGDNNASVNNITVTAHSGDTINFYGTSGATLVMAANSAVRLFGIRNGAWRALQLG